MTWYRPSFISRIDGGLDSKLYVDILEECVPLTVNHYKINKDKMIFQ